MTGLGQDVVLRMKGNLSFVGTYMEDFSFQGKKGLFLQLDRVNQVMLWCPEDMVQEIIPLSEGVRTPTSGREW